MTNSPRSWVDSARSLKHQAVERSRLATIAAVDLLRRGSRTVITPPDGGLRFGNLLYLWLQAHQRSASQGAAVVRWVPAMDLWLDEFPVLRTVTVASAEVRFSDRRAWDADWLFQRFDIDFDRASLDAFVTYALSPHIPLLDPDPVVLNIRRGDYYTDFADKYAFNQAAYVDAALERIGGAPRVIVVSDDQRWCRLNLDAVVRAHAQAVEYAAPDPVENFRTLAGSRRIIGTNSTFSYWGAYAAGAVRNDTQIVMPAFHARMAHGTAAHQLDPQWIALNGFH